MTRSRSCPPVGDVIVQTRGERFCVACQRERGYDRERGYPSTNLSSTSKYFCAIAFRL